MKRTLAQVGSFDRPLRLLFLNQLTINTGFYMLMPYLAMHLGGSLGLSAWLIGLILGIRNLSQQGMFLIGGTLADRLGYKPMILAGLVLRTAGFALLGFGTTVPVLVVASALTGLAGALFNPAVRAYVAHEAGERKVEAFGVFNVFYQLGIVLGPLLGLVLIGVAFQFMCAVAAGLFAILAVLQARALPARSGTTTGEKRTVLQDWRAVLANRPFLLFALAMTGSYVLNFQVYLGLPIEVRRLTGGEAGVTLLFVVSGVLTVAGQVRVTAWAKRHLSPARAIALGIGLMATAFAPLAIAAPLLRPVAAGSVLAYGLVLVPAIVSAALLAVGTMIVYPFEMATIVDLAAGRTVGTYYGLYSTLTGFAIAAGNLGAGAALDAGRDAGIPSLPWIALILIGVLCAFGVHTLDRTGRLAPREPVGT